jgi:hypothetical protein
MNDAQRFTELTGGCRHVRTSKYSAICRKCKADICSAPSISYDNAADILNRMRDYCGEERYREFIEVGGIGIVYHSGVASGYRWLVAINEDYILDHPALLKKAVEFLKGEE